jgi:hypothetical protein
MNNKNTILLLTCMVLICAGVFVFAQTNQPAKDQNANVSLTNSNSKNAQQNSNRSNYKPKEGYVADEETAITIAVAVWKPIYGKEKIENEKPYKASLKDSIWTVTGSLPKGWKGGVAEAEISKDDGRILQVIHGK